MSRLSQGLPIFIVGKSIHSEIVKQTVYYGKSVYEARGGGLNFFRTFRMQQDTPRSAQQFVKITDYTSVLKCSILRNLTYGTISAVIGFSCPIISLEY